MVKVMHFLTRKPEITHDKCIKYHRDVYAPKAAGIIGFMMSRYVAYYLDENPNLPYDWIIEEWYEDDQWEKFQEFKKTAEYLELREDANTFIYREKAFSVRIEDNVIV